MHMKMEVFVSSLGTYHIWDYFHSISQLPNHAPRALKDISEYYGVSIYNHNNLSEGIHSIGEFKFEVIYTPGHSADSTTYYFFEDKKMFVGDFIFRGDIGRCDLPGGDENEMLNSIIRIKEYSNCNVYPGHGEATTLDDERRSNQYFKIERV